MKEFEFDKVIKRLTQLKEQPFNEITRIGSMLSLGFGDKIKSKAAMFSAKKILIEKSIPSNNFFV